VVSFFRNLSVPFLTVSPYHSSVVKVLFDRLLSTKSPMPSTLLLRHRMLSSTPAGTGNFLL
ncbi:hypothetical protein, partial [uncultured Anaerolinea sp.]|uniref:hypothetical protein n=1 Tax=uncultured Anaerolinea sp. TaxID=430695 RepID=UPI002624F89F